MDTFITLLLRMIALMFMMACGYAAYKVKWVGDKGYADLSKIVANILNPLLIINSALNADKTIAMNLIVQNVILVVVCYGSLIIIGLLLPLVFCRNKYERPQYNLMTVFSNVGFMAIPVLGSIYGEKATIYIVFYLLGFNILIYTYGIVLCAKTKEGAKAKISLKAILNPGVIACVIAVIIFACKLDIGDPFTTICSYMGNATIPFSMFITGVSIAMFPIKEFVSDWKVYVYSLIKLLVIPIICALIIKQIPMDEMVKNVFVYEMAMPVGALVLALVKNHGENEIVSSRGIVVTTLMSLITIPLISFFL